MTEPENGHLPQHRPFWRSPRSLLYAVAVVFLAVVLWRSRFWDSGEALRDVDPVYFVAIPLLSLALALPLALRARVMLAALGFRASAVSLAPLAFYGNTVGFLTPAASGEALRPALFKRTFGVPVAQGIGVVFFERLFSFFLVGLSCLLALTWTDEAPAWLGPVALPLLLAACLAPTACAALAPAAAGVFPAGRLARLLPDRIRQHVEESSATLSRLWTDLAVVAGFVFLSAGVFLAMGLQFWLLPEALGQGISLQEAYVVLTASAMAGFLSGLPLGLGATDAVMFSLLRAYGVETTEAGQIVILNRVLINLPGGLFGLTAYLIALRQRPNAEATPPTAHFTAASVAGERK
jgi:uncharacterized membrane protein YbhN (UPF0104 family)